MSAPTSPFATSAQVGFFLPNLLVGATDFSASTKPTKNAVDSIIGWVSSQIEMQFGSAGYLVPLTVITGESWPTSQTNFLAMITCLGTAAYVGGHSLKPAPAVAPGREGGTGNLFQNLFNAELEKIWDGRSTRLRFRARYYAGTPAEEALAQPMGPGSDFMEGQFDPTRYGTVWEVTESMRAVQLAIRDLEIDWDYLYAYKSFNAGLGSV